MSISPKPQLTSGSVPEPLESLAGHETPLNPLEAHTQSVAHKSLEASKTPLDTPPSPLRASQPKEQIRKMADRVIKLLEGRPIGYIIQGKFKLGFEISRENFIRLSTLGLSSRSLSKMSLERLKLVEDSGAKRVELLNRFMGRDSGGGGIYNAGCRIDLNRANLDHYVASKDFERHKQSVKVYHGSDLDTSKAQRIATQREPVNIATVQHYSKTMLKKLMGYEQSAFQEDVGTRGAKVACIYSQTFLWNPPGGKEKVEVGVLSVPAPALDHINQPQFEHYVTDVVDRSKPQPQYSLNGEKYKEHMSTIAKAVVSAAVDNKENTKRLVIPLYGQAAFLGMINGEGKELAGKIFQETLAEALLERADELKGIEVVISEFSSDKGEKAAEAINKALEQKGSELKVGSILGDIKKTALAGDLIVNAWDPHSAPGNGNEGDPSFDGQMGRSTGILATQTNWFNTELNNPERYEQISS